MQIHSKVHTENETVNSHED